MGQVRLRWLRFALVATPLLAALLAAAAACDEPHLRTEPGQNTSAAGACEAKAGQLPAPDCDNSSGECTATPGCTVDEAACGSLDTCLPIGSNAGKTQLDFRIRRLNVAAPAALAADFIQKNIVTSGIDLQQRQCGEQGKGLFSWLLRVDKGAGEIVTGGAPPAEDPLGKGFCFASFLAGETPVGPVRMKMNLTGNTFSAGPVERVNIPIFLSDDLSSAVILPISEARLQGVTLSDDGNCIGAVNRVALDPSCKDDPAMCSKWRTAGSLGGYITLEEADAVFVKDLGRTLCLILSNEDPPPDNRCARDSTGTIKFKGDYCSKDKQPGSCADSVWLAATFAASAAKIFPGGDGVEGCATTLPERDAGSDGGSDGGDAGGSEDAGDGGDGG